MAYPQAAPAETLESPMQIKTTLVRYMVTPSLALPTSEDDCSSRLSVRIKRTGGRAGAPWVG